jgi:hypothetical protein
MALVGVPAGQIAAMRQAPFWPAMEKAAPTLAYDHAAILGPEAAIPAGLVSRVAVPVLLLSGSKSFPFMKTTAGRLSTLIPHARFRILEGQTHEVSPEVLAPVLVEFFGGSM